MDTEEIETALLTECNRLRRAIRKIEEERNTLFKLMCDLANPVNEGLCLGLLAEKTLKSLGYSRKMTTGQWVKIEEVR